MEEHVDDVISVNSSDDDDDFDMSLQNILYESAADSPNMPSQLPTQVISPSAEGPTQVISPDVQIPTHLPEVSNAAQVPAQTTTTQILNNQVIVFQNFNSYPSGPRENQNPYGNRNPRFISESNANNQLVQTSVFTMKR